MFVLQGSNGQITARIARQLLAAGHPVRILGRRAATLTPLADAGAAIAVGESTDPDFLARAFDGANAVYTMIPPCYAEADMRVAQDRIGEATARALALAGVPRVVQLSSIGADLASGTGPIEGLHAQEARLRAIAGLDLVSLRPGSFMENLLPLAGVIAAAGVLPGMEAPDAGIPMAATADIAAVAARELVTPTHRGVLNLQAPGTVTMRQAAQVLGTAIGRPDLAYVQSPAADAKAALRAQGFSADAADQLETLARWLSTSPVSDARAAPVEHLPTTLEAFARAVFTPVFSSTLATVAAEASRVR